MPKNKSTIISLLFLGFSFLLIVVSCKKDPAFTASDDEIFNLAIQAGGKNATVFDHSVNAFGNAIDGLSFQELNDFASGNSFFRNNWVTAPSSVESRDGLGPLFNSLSCGGCHAKDGRSAPLQTNGEAAHGLLMRLSVAGQNANGEPNPDPNYGGQFNHRAILNVQPEGNIEINYAEQVGTFDDGVTYSLRKPTYTFSNLNYGNISAATMQSPRVANQLIGLGLLEAISEQTLLELADESDRDGDGISGKIARVWNRETNTFTVGRFGWKASQPSVLSQIAAAFNGDIGVTSSLFPSEGLSPAQVALYGSLPHGGEPEVNDERLARVQFYMQTIAVPAARFNNPIEYVEGKQLFIATGCAKCHTPEMVTGNEGVAQLTNQKIHAYTDMLLHDMGAGLSDNRPVFNANGNEWRTPPLWGIGLIPTVNGHSTLLHDGRARNITEAILWHGGEAENAKNSFVKLDQADRDILVGFIEKL